MASSLNDKINSYALEKGIEFDQAYSLTPTQTGSVASVTFTLAGNTPRRVFDGPSGGAGSSWEFDWTTSSATNTYYHNNSTPWRTTFNDGDYSTGFWFKVPTLPANASFNRIFEVAQTGGIAGFALDVMGTTNANGSFTGPKLKLATDATLSTSTYTTTPLLANTWYYFALIKTGTTTSNFKAYLNGTEFANVTHSGTAGSLIRFTFGRNGTSPSAGSYRFANFYSTTSSTIGATQIAEIYTTGIAGYEKALQDIGTNPSSWYKFDNQTGGDLVSDSGTTNQEINLSSTPTWITYPNAISKGGISLAAFTGYDANPLTTYNANNTIAFWFKRSAPPTSQLQWSSKFWNSTQKWNTASEAGINTDGRITFAPTLGTAQPALTSTKNICDNQWHYVVITRASGTNARMYIDGILESSQTWGTGTIPLSSFLPFMGQGNQFDEFTWFDTLTLSASQVLSLYETVMGPSSTNYTDAADPMLATNADFPMPVHTAESVVNVTYNSEAFGGEFNTATLIGPMLSIGVDLDAPGIEAASADLIDPITSTTKNVTYSDSPSTATATMILPIVSTQRFLDYSASSMTASSLLSSNVYFGPTIEDASYHVTLRQVTASVNTDGKNGFFIGSQYSNNILDTKVSLAIKANTGIPATGGLVKVKLHPTHVGVVSSGDIAPTNTFNVYVFTANPTTTFNTMTYANLPTRELLYTTRSSDNDGQRLDLTTAFKDSRAATYGIFIEHVATLPYGSGTQYDRTEYTGTNLEDKGLYILTSEFVTKNVNANAMTADSQSVMPSIEIQKFLSISAAPATASSDIVNPAVSAEISVAYASGPLTASAAAVQPGFARTVQYTSDHLEADARTVTPTLFITGVVNYSASVSTASALFHDAQYSIGDGHSADHMDSSALFVDPLLVINESVPAMLATVSAEIVDPEVGGQLLGRISAEPMMVQSFLPMPPNLDPITNDNWFNRLYGQDLATPDKRASIYFMKPAQLSTTGTLGIGSTISSVAVAPSNAAEALSSDNGILSPTPAASQNIFDGWNRKAIALRNISFRTRNPIAGSEIANRIVDRGYTLEAMIRTRKANQILFIGQNGGTFEANAIGLKDGKLFINSSTSSALQMTDARLLNATTLMQATKTNIADNQWHHILIQFGFDGRHQFWVDGELELQRYGYRTNYVSLIGYNSSNPALSSEFDISVFSNQVEAFLSERDVQLNYFAAINYAPVQAEPMTASLRMTEDHTAKGNRGRALMLYFWSTSSLSFNNYRQYEGGLNLSLQRNTGFDQGSDYFDYDTSASLSTWELVGKAPQQWQGWDIFPVDVQGIYASSVVKPSAYKNLSTPTFFGGQSPVSWKQAEGFFDEQTDNRRYIDLINDIENLEDFDLIMFRNYPDQGSELDSFSKFESVDSYFQLQEKALFEDFLKSLRAAVDTGISLLVTNPQLAIDLEIIDRVEIVPDLTEQVASRSDVYAASRLASTTGTDYRTNNDPGAEDTLFYFADSYKNNRHRLVNEIDGLTTIPSYIWKETIYYNNDGAVDFAGMSRWWNKYDYKSSGIQAGDEFLISTNNVSLSKVIYQAVPFANIKSGKPLTAFASTTNQNGIDVLNPYRNYATSIVLEPGDVLAGKQIGGKIFVSFTETLQKVGNYDTPREYGQIDLNTDERINFAYEQGAITLNQRNSYLQNINTNLDRRLQAGLMTQQQYNGLTYWSDNGDNIVSAIEYGNTQEVVAEGSPTATGERNAPLNRYALKPNQRTVQNFSSSGPWFTISWGYTTPRVNIWVPNINVRAFNWLYNREFLEGQIQSHTAQRVSALMVDPSVSADTQRTVNVQAMLSNATITQGAYSNSRSIASLPFEASARMIDRVKSIPVLPMTASAVFRESIRVLTTSIDEVVLYVYHEDPVLYLREEVIK